MAYKYYGVQVGATTGVFQSWDACEKSVSGYSGAVFKGFHSYDEALAFSQGNHGYDTLTNIYHPGSNRIMTDEDLEKATKEAIQERKQKYGDFSTELVAYVDGSYDPQSRLVGGGALILLADSMDEVATISEAALDLGRHQNVAGEILGATRALQWCLDWSFDSITVVYDYVGLEKWATQEWRANKPITQAYADFVTTARLGGLRIDFQHVKSHSGNQYNDRADKLARLAIGLL